MEDIQMRSHEDRRMNRIQRHSGFNRLVLGAFILIAGFLLILKNVGILSPENGDIIFSWQMLLIALGLLNFTKPRHWFSGLILIAIGGFFMLREFSGAPIELITKYFWGGFLVVLGLLMILRVLRFGHHESWVQFGEDSADYIDEVAIFSGADRKITSNNFKGGRITCILGGSNLDFTDAKMAEGRNVLDVVSIFGGFKLVVPPEWNIKVETTSVLGGISDKRVKFTDEGNNNKILYIKGVAIFGGGEIKNYA